MDGESKSKQGSRAPCRSDFNATSRRRRDANTQLLTTATTEAKAIKGNALPPPIERSRTRLTTAHVSLDEVVAPRIAGDTKDIRKADRWIDAAWSAGLTGSLAGASSLPKRTRTSTRPGP